jgi:hypothetical protein
MSEKTKSHIYIGKDQALGLLTNERSDRMPDARNKGEALDILNYFGVIEIDCRKKEVVDFLNIKRITHYLEVASRFLNRDPEQTPVKGVFQKLYEKELVRNLDEFNDFWAWRNYNRDEMDELEEELEILSHAYLVYRKAFYQKKQHKGTRISKRRRKKGTGKVRAD